MTPGFVATEMTAILFQDEQGRKRLLSNLPLGRIGTVKDVAGAALCLACEASSYIKGHYPLCGRGLENPVRHREKEDGSQKILDKKGNDCLREGTDRQHEVAVEG